MSTEEILEWLSELFNEPKGSISLETLREDIPEWDSLGALTLMAEMDEKFGVVLSNSELDSLSAVSDIMEVLRKNDKIAS